MERPDLAGVLSGHVPENGFNDCVWLSPAVMILLQIRPGDPVLFGGYRMTASGTFNPSKALACEDTEKAPPEISDGASMVLTSGSDGDALDHTVG